MTTTMTTIAREAITVANDDLLGVPDIRSFNGAPWSDDGARAEAMTRLYEAVADWAHWSAQRRARFVKRVVLRTAREVVSQAVRACGLQFEAANLRRASTFAKVEVSAYAAYAAARYAALDAAAVSAADAAAADAAAAAADAVYAAAHAAARAAWERAAWERAASAAANAARDAAHVVRDAAAADELLRTAVKIWVEAAQRREELR